MEWTNWACAMAGCFVGSFAMTVWQNERRRRSAARAGELYAVTFNRGRFYPPAKSDPPTPPPNSQHVPARCGAYCCRSGAERIKITASEREALIVASIELQALAMRETNHSHAIRELLRRAENG